MKGDVPWFMASLIIALFIIGIVIALVSWGNLKVKSSEMHPKCIVEAESWCLKKRSVLGGLSKDGMQDQWKNDPEVSEDCKNLHGNICEICKDSYPVIECG